MHRDYLHTTAAIKRALVFSKEYNTICYKLGRLIINYTAGIKRGLVCSSLLQTSALNTCFKQAR